MKNKQIGLGIGTLLLVLLLAAGMFTAVQLLTPQETEVVGAGNGRTIQSVQVDNNGASVAINSTILPAVELPDSPSAAFGILQSKQDNTIVIGTGSIDLEVDVEVDPETGQETTTFLPTISGPDVEVVITPDTIIYKDVTDFAQNQMNKSGEQTIQQLVRAVGSLEDIGTNSELEVWGEKRGDRIVAEIVVFGPLAGGSFE